MIHLGIKHTKTPPYTPEANRVERAHQTLGSLLRSAEGGPATDWTAKLKPAVLAYNTMMNRVTGVSPYFAVFGRNCQLPLDLVLAAPGSTNSQQASTEAESYIRDLRQRFRAIYSYMLKNQD